MAVVCEAADTRLAVAVAVAAAVVEEHKQV